MGWRDKVQAPNTISDEKWRGIQTRAARANPKRADVMSKESDQERRASAKNYEKRNDC